MKKEKHAPSTSSAPAVASQHSESKEVVTGSSPNRSLSPLESKTPSQETELEPPSTEEKQNVHTGTLTPKLEVSVLFYSKMEISAVLHP